MSEALQRQMNRMRDRVAAAEAISPSSPTKTLSSPQTRLVENFLNPKPKVVAPAKVS